jgi:hypothetical protein
MQKDLPAFGRRYCNLGDIAGRSPQIRVWPYGKIKQREKMKLVAMLTTIAVIAFLFFFAPWVVRLNDSQVKTSRLSSLAQLSPKLALAWPEYPALTESQLVDVAIAADMCGLKDLQGFLDKQRIFNCLKAGITMEKSANPSSDLSIRLEPLLR